MTRDEVIATLIRDFDLLDCLDQWDDVIRERAMEDERFTGLSEDHPQVQQYRRLCRQLMELGR